MPSPKSPRGDLRGGITMNTNIFDSLLPVFTKSIFGIALDLTTIAVAVFGIALVVFGGDLVLRMLFVSPKSESSAFESDPEDDYKDRDLQYLKRGKKE